MLLSWEKDTRLCQDWYKRLKGLEQKFKLIDNIGIIWGIWTRSEKWLVDTKIFISDRFCITIVSDLIFANNARLVYPKWSIKHNQIKLFSLSISICLQKWMNEPFNFGSTPLYKLPGLVNIEPFYTIFFIALCLEPFRKPEKYFTISGRDQMNVKIHHLWRAAQIQLVIL